MPSLTLSLVQTSLHWEDKTANLLMLEEKIRSIVTPTQVVVLPEMFSTGFSMRPEDLAETIEGTTVQWMKGLSAEKKIILTGSIMVQDGTHYYNRLLWVLPNGTLGYYDKRHCFGYAGEDKHYTPGQHRLIAQVNGWKIHLQVCYDLRFPVWARQQSDIEPEYDLLINVANWPERRNHAWKTLLTARAIENQCYVVGVNRVGTDGKGIYYSGNSLVADPLGEWLFHEEHSECIHTISLQQSALKEIRSQFPFWKDADTFQLLPNPSHG